MNVITTTEDLSAFCKAAASKSFICVDTEFMRESTFYSQLCLIQAATKDSEVIIDPLASGIDLAPFLDILMNPNITKVMHAARQDMEIFYMLCKEVPAPLFDTQIAAMALGFGDSCGYMALVKGRLNINLDKGARFTDWSRRPLSEKQLSYAMGDVTHLRDLYPDMISELEERGRLNWVLEEMEPQLDKELYEFDPENAWARLKVRNYKKPYLAVLRAVAAWREREAISRDIPRRRVMKDDSLYDLALNKPTTVKTMERLRSIPRGFEKSSKAKSLLDAIEAALANVDEYAPNIQRPKNMPPNTGPSAEMLKTLLRLRTEYVDIAPRLVANNSDIEKIAAFGENADVAALKGWRREVFGNDALQMLDGKIALRLEGKEVVAEEI